MNSESLKLRGTLRGHNGWVTQIATNPKFPDMILSASRGNMSHSHRPRFASIEKPRFTRHFCNEENCSHEVHDFY